MSKATNDDFEVPTLSEHPTPDERSNYVIMRLEQFIREGRTLDEGMSFKKWQAMARTDFGFDFVIYVKNVEDAKTICLLKISKMC